MLYGAMKVFVADKDHINCLPLATRPLISSMSKVLRAKADFRLRMVQFHFGFSYLLIIRQKFNKSIF